MEYTVGVALALGISSLATVVGLDRDRAFYPTLMIVIASYYGLFAANVLRSLFGRLGRRISGGRPGELLADGAHDFLGDLRTFKERMLFSQLAADRPARFANGADNAVERGIGTFADRLHAVTRGAVLLQVLRFVAHLLLDRHIERIGNEGHVAGQVRITPGVQRIR